MSVLRGLFGGVAKVGISIVRDPKKAAEKIAAAKPIVRGLGNATNDFFQKNAEKIREKNAARAVAAKPIVRGLATTGAAAAKYFSNPVSAATDAARFGIEKYNEKKTRTARQIATAAAFGGKATQYLNNPTEILRDVGKVGISIGAGKLHEKNVAAAKKWNTEYEKVADDFTYDVGGVSPGLEFLGTKRVDEKKYFEFRDRVEKSEKYQKKVEKISEKFSAGKDLQKAFREANFTPEEYYVFERSDKISLEMRKGFGEAKKMIVDTANNPRGAARDFGRGFFGAFMNTLNIVPTAEKAFFEVSRLDKTNFGQKRVARAEEMIGINDRLQNEIASQAETPLGQGIGSGGASLAQMGAISRISGSMRIASGTLAASETHGMYLDAREAGKSPEYSLGLATATGIAVATLEKLGFESIFPAQKTGIIRGLARVPIATATEAGTEGTQQSVQNFVEKYGYNKSKNIADGILESILVGGFVGGAANISNTTIEKIAEKVAEKEKIAKSDAAEFVKSVGNFATISRDDFFREAKLAFRADPNSDGAGRFGEKNVRPTFPQNGAGNFLENRTINFSKKVEKEISRGNFGKIFTNLKRNEKAATEKLIAEKDGEVIGALFHKDIGEIDLPWGIAGTGSSDGYGLAKIVKFHPEMIGKIQASLDEMEIISKSENRIMLGSEKHEASVRLDWDGQKKEWLLTAYEKISLSPERRTDIFRDSETEVDGLQKVPHPKAKSENIISGKAENVKSEQAEFFPDEKKGNLEEIAKKRFEEIGKLREQKESGEISEIDHKSKLLEILKHNKNWTNRFVKLRVKLDDKEIVLKKLRDIPDTKQIADDDAYDAEMLKHGRTDARIDEAVGDGFEFGKMIKKYGDTSGKSYENAEKEVNDFLFADAIREGNLTEKIEVRAAESFDPEIKKIANKMLEYHKETGEYLQEEGILSEFSKTARLERLHEIAYKWDEKASVLRRAKKQLEKIREKLQKKKNPNQEKIAEKTAEINEKEREIEAAKKEKNIVPTNVLDNIIFARAAAVSISENNRVRRELWNMWKNNEENRFYQQLFEEVKEADLERYQAEILKKFRAKKSEIKKQKETAEQLENLKIPKKAKIEKRIAGIDERVKNLSEKIKIQKKEKDDTDFFLNFGAHEGKNIKGLNTDYLKWGISEFGEDFTRDGIPWGEIFQDEILERNGEKSNGAKKAAIAKAAKRNIEKWEKELDKLKKVRKNLELEKEKKENRKDEAEYDIRAEIEKKIRILEKEKAKISGKSPEAEKIAAEIAEWEQEKADYEKVIGTNDPTHEKKLKIRQKIVSEKIAEIETEISDTTLFPENFRKDLMTFLWAKHAPERNKVHGENAAGMRTEVAIDEVKRIAKTPYFSEIEKFAEKIWAIDAENLKILFDGKIISKKEYFEVKNFYKFHIPLRREFGDQTAEIQVSDISKKDLDPPIWRAKGSDLPIKDLLENVEFFGKRAHKLVVQKMEMQDLEKEVLDLEIKIAEAEKEKKEVSLERAKQKTTNLQKEIAALEKQKAPENISAAAAEKLAAEKEREKQILERQIAESEVTKERREQKIAEISGEIEFQKEERRKLSERYDKPLEFLRVKIDGEMKVLRIKDAMVARAINNSEISDVPLMLMSGTMLGNIGKKAWEIAAGGTNIVGRLATTYNLPFMVGNQARDIQTNLVNFWAEEGSKEAFKATKKIPKNWKVIAEFLMDKDTPETRLYKQFLKDGGTTGGISLSLFRSSAENFRKLNLAKNAKKITDAPALLNEIFRHLNEIAENSTRFATYKQALEEGKSRRSAAIIAKNITVNFNKKGEWMQYVNQIFLFSNAALQGTKNYYGRSFKDGKINPKFFTAMLAVMSLKWISMALMDSFDPEWREKTNEWERGANFIFPMFGGNGFSAIKIPMSLEFASVGKFAEMGYNLAFGYTEPKNAVREIVGSFGGAMNILGQSGTAAQQFSPTLARPIIGLFQDVKWNEQGIVPSGKGAEHEKYYKNTVESTTGRAFIGLSRFLYEKTGWDTSPEQWKYLTEQYTSGAGRTVMQITNIATSPTETPPEKFPILDRFYIHREGKELEDLIQRNRAEKEKRKNESWINSLFGGWEIFETTEGAIVARVIDGDTIEVILENDKTEKVRILGIDTPESKNSKKEIEFGAIESSVRAKKLLLGKEVILKKGDEDEDKNHRKLRFVEFIGGEKYDEIMVREGHARVSAYEENPEKYDEMLAEAQKNRAGVWARDGLDLTDAEIEKKLLEIQLQRNEERNVYSADFSDEKRAKILNRIDAREMGEKIDENLKGIRKITKNPDGSEKFVEKGSPEFLLKEVLEDELRNLITLENEIGEYSPNIEEYETKLKNMQKKRRTGGGTSAATKKTTAWKFGNEFVNVGMKKMRAENPKMNEKQLVATALWMNGSGAGKTDLSISDAREFLEIAEAKNPEEILRILPLGKEEFGVELEKLK